MQLNELNLIGWMLSRRLSTGSHSAIFNVKNHGLFDKPFTRGMKNEGTSWKTHQQFPEEKIIHVIALQIALQSTETKTDNNSIRYMPPAYRVHALHTKFRTAYETLHRDSASVR